MKPSATIVLQTLTPDDMMGVDNSTHLFNPCSPVFPRTLTFPAPLHEAADITLHLEGVVGELGDPEHDRCAAPIGLSNGGCRSEI